MFRRYSHWKPLVAIASLLLVCGQAGADDETPEDEDKIKLEAIGSLAAAQVYTAYGYIGVTADAFVEDAFDAKQVTDLMNEVVSMIDINIQALRKVQPSVAEEDQKFIDQLIEVYALVKDEGQALVAYAESKNTDDAEAFETARTSVWPKLKVLLGIE